MSVRRVPRDLAAGFAGHWPSRVVLLIGALTLAYGARWCVGNGTCSDPQPRAFVLTTFLVFGAAVVLVARTVDARTWRARALWAARTVSVASLVMWSFGLAVLIGEIESGVTGLTEFAAVIALAAVAAVVAVVRTSTAGWLMVLVAFALPFSTMRTPGGWAASLPFSTGVLVLGIVLLGAATLAEYEMEPDFRTWLRRLAGGSEHLRA